MHKIEHLLQTLAPKGVEFRKLGEVCEILDNRRIPIAKNKRNPGIYPYYGANGIQDYIDSYIFDGDFVLVGEDGSVINKDNTPIVNWASGKIWVNNHAHVLQTKNELKLKFLYFYLQTIDVSYCVAGTPPKINQENLKKITIPIPPLEIQQEIVNILDAFTELNTELNTELKARKKQYQYYQNMLLDFKDTNQNHQDAKMSAKPYPKRLKTLLQTLAPKGVEFRKLGEVCESTNKKTLKISEVSEVKNKRMYPVINSGRDLYGYYHDFNNDGENITIASRGEYAGFINYFNEKFFAGGLCYPYKVKDTNELLTKFLYFYLKTNEIQIMENLVSRGSIPALNKADIETLTIPIPPLEIQQEIVKILDQFLALTTDLLAGIPAEIEARKKQYEYYREKLLAFKPLTPHKEVKKC
ncbi:Type I restriction-modification system specificity subunit [Helicobacter pylori F32]|uniref:restriction endonuclease subunit S n=1 Tax=Helicobacter pylori TaxID=210 RepID=UPI0001F46D20|nr:restriction endonuclease subunit S [Helicobacter pylori]WRC21513.1 restriction endonuclease subunit S [Helicobacter pylori]BAJ58339.1 Type I restriction-modification system specificity subunit [Helicobacter pylori F32]